MYLGRREIDLHYEWHTIQDGQIVQSLKTFIEKEKQQEVTGKNNDANLFPILPNFNSSNEQQELIDIFEEQMNFLRGNNVEQILKKWVVVQAGSGKVH